MSLKVDIPDVSETFTILRSGYLQSPLSSTIPTPTIPTIPTIPTGNAITKNDTRQSTSTTFSSKCTKIFPLLSHTSWRNSKRFKPTLTAIPPALTNLYVKVNKWAKDARSEDCISLKIDDSLDGENVAYIFHISLNPNMKYRFEVVYACKSNMIVIRKLNATKLCILPPMKIVGKEQVLN